MDNYKILYINENITLTTSKIHKSIKIMAPQQVIRSANSTGLIKEKRENSYKA